jgi:hypothetical protein
VHSTRQVPPIHATRATAIAVKVNDHWKASFCAVFSQETVKFLIIATNVGRDMDQKTVNMDHRRIERMGRNDIV